MKDIVAGITVGLIVVPQGMSYAKVAGLPVQHGLYSAYIGALFYCFMGTSKDLTIGPTAVISLITGELVAQLADQYSPAQVAGMSCLAVGALTMILGIFQLGIVLDFFPTTVLVGYTTGAAVTIVVSQIPKWIGVSGVNTREPPLLILLHTFRALPTLSWLDLLFGILSMAGLAGLGLAVDRWGRGRFSIQLIKISRFFIVTVLATWCSYMVHMGAPLDEDGHLVPRLSILQTVPAGLPRPQAPPINGDFLRKMAPQLMAISLATILEHIAIGKAFARKNRYQIDGNQELLTLGLANVTASFFGAYTVTGSFSRSAVKFQCGVKTPMAGFVTGALVLLALHVLTPLFFYIPDAALSAVIMVAVSSLVSPPTVFLEFFHVNLWDFLSSQVALWVTLFVSVEAGIASGVGFSLLVLLFRVARPQLHTLRPLKYRQDVFVASADSFDSDEDDYNNNHDDVDDDEFFFGATDHLPSHPYHHRYPDYDALETINPPPGILIFRMEEAATFPNMETFKTWAQDQVYKHTRFGGRARTAQDRLWSDDLEIHIRRLRAPKILRSYPPGPHEDDDDDQGHVRHQQQTPLFSKKTDPRTHRRTRTRTRNATTSAVVTTQRLEDENLPRLRAVILDCSAMNQIDSTGLQGLRDLRENLRDYAGARDDPSWLFELHFVAVQRNVLRILRRSGLLTPLPQEQEQQQISGTPLQQVHVHQGQPPPPPPSQQQHQQQQRTRVSQDSHSDRGSDGSDRGSASSYGSFTRRGAPAVSPKLNSLVHLTIRDAIHAILRRAAGDGGGGGDTGTSAGVNGQAVEEDGPWAVSDSDESEHAPSLHKYSSTLPLHAI
ncbi:hypothetical protein BGZ70_002734 [Mortierella alpina]|uniref:STAS domain-containing protein n=1 Tax=Mortierella alpina TaxID=64518 RepID=A0A9P6ITQ5_MORAP|nr:hypothetical protein BGZ70_002734 [Mortierella alpina]